MFKTIGRGNECSRLVGTVNCHDLRTNAYWKTEALPLVTGGHIELCLHRESKTLQTGFETDTFNALNVGSSQNFVETVSELSVINLFSWSNET
jgi:hypothetical protein